jgi:hypothetical protein
MILCSLTKQCWWYKDLPASRNLLNLLTLRALRIWKSALWRLVDKQRLLAIWRKSNMQSDEAKTIAKRYRLTQHRKQTKLFQGLADIRSFI